MSTLAVIDNYDSFTYNLVQYLRELGAEVEVYRNDQISVEQLRNDSIKALLLSPGPGNPDTAGITLDVLNAFAGKLPILGVCLGHQSIGQHFGGQITHAKQIMHGKLSEVHHNGEGVFANLPSPFVATRYHSLVIAPDTVPECLQVTAWTVDEAGNQEEVMGVRHRTAMVEGVQFHPESISSEHGHALVSNFLRYSGLTDGSGLTDAAGLTNNTGLIDSTNSTGSNDNKAGLTT